MGAACSGVGAVWGSARGGPGGSVAARRRHGGDVQRRGSGMGQCDDGVRAACRRRGSGGGVEFGVERVWGRRGGGMEATRRSESELRVYRHAQDPSLFGVILGLSTRRFLSCRGSRIAPYDPMNATFLVTPTASAGTPVYRAVSEAFRFPMRGSWQATRRKNANFCQNGVSRKICSAPSPFTLPQAVYSSSCPCKCIKRRKKT